MEYDIERVEEFLKESNRFDGLDNPKADQVVLEIWELFSKKEKLNYLDLLAAHRLLAETVGKEGGKFRSRDLVVGEDLMKARSKSHNILQVTHLFALMRNAEVEEGKESDFVKRCHLIFHNIYPFELFGGIIGRLLYVWHRQKTGLALRLPRKEAYYQWFVK